MIMIQNNKAMIEDFDTVVLISGEKMILKQGNRLMSIEGKGLHVCLYSEDQIVFAGKIGNIRFEEI